MRSFRNQPKPATPSEHHPVRVTGAHDRAARRIRTTTQSQLRREISVNPDFNAGTKANPLGDWVF
jgi:hypothetical protein